MRVKIEMDYAVFQLIRDAMQDSSQIEQVVLSNYGDNLSEYAKNRMQKTKVQLDIVSELFFQSYLNSI